MDIRTALKQGLSQLRDAQVPSYTLTAELLLLHSLGRERAWIYAHPEEEVAEADAARFFALLNRRMAGEPTQHLTGKQEFWSLEFEVSRDVLIPRPETEHVIEVALDRLAVREIRAGRPQKNSGEGLIIADIGTGSGCIAIALAKELPAAKIYATEISPGALNVARRNATRHDLRDRIQFLKCNLLDGIAKLGAQHSLVCAQDEAAPRLGTIASSTEQRSHFFDLIASNPPYIGRREAETLAREVRDHEPKVALCGGEEGYELYGDLIAQAAQCLKPGGILVLELGHNTLPAVQPLLEDSIWTNIGVTNDLAGIPRVIAAERL